VKKKGLFMKRKEIISTLFLAAAMMALNTGPVSAQSTGGSQSERSGTDSQTPLPPKSPSSGSGDKSNTGKMPSAQSKPSGKANDEKSVGGSQSDRSGTDTQTPLPPKSPSSGSGDESKAGKNSTK